MSRRTKKQAVIIDVLVGLILVGSLLGGWFITRTLKGTVIFFGIACVLMLSLTVWRMLTRNKRLKL